MYSEQDDIFKLDKLYLLGKKGVFAEKGNYMKTPILDILKRNVKVFIKKFESVRISFIFTSFYIKRMNFLTFQNLVNPKSILT